MSVAYCPWCGRRIDEETIYPQTRNILWNKCSDVYCKGRGLDLITDKQGFVIHPRHIRGRYVYARPDKEH